MTPAPAPAPAPPASEAPPPAPVELDSVSKSFGEVPAVDALTLSVAGGELLAILGPSGSGKSTALRLIAGLERPDAGAIRIGGEDVTDRPAPERGVSMVFQSFALFPHLTAARNIAFGLEARRVEPGERARRVAEIAEWMGLDGLLDRRPAELSGGERQRVALARGLVRRPRVLLMDEPLSNVDAPLRARIRAEIKRIHAETAVTILYVTHDEAEADELADRIAVIEGGRLLRVEPPPA